MNRDYVFLKLPPERQKMEPPLESLRSLEIRRDAVARDFGKQNPEYLRFRNLAEDLRSNLTNAQLKAYADYMGRDHSAPAPEVPEEGEQERSI